MLQNFVSPQCDQPLLLPADMREWLPEDDLVFVVLDAVGRWIWASSAAGTGLTGTAGRRPGPEMMVALLLYGYCPGRADPAG